MRLNHFFGGVLLIAGTAIGGGMLALPVTTAFAGFFPSAILLFCCWLFLLVTAFLFLEVNLSVSGDADIISMAEKRLGKMGKIISWSAYLLLLYCLTSAYLAGGAPLFAHLIESLFSITLPRLLVPIPFLLFLGTFVYLGTRSVDFLNRIFMLGLIITYGVLAIFLPSYVQKEYLFHSDSKAVLFGLPIVVTSFGFHIIIPTLTSYLSRNKNKLQWMIAIGSLLPLLVYLFWEYILLGSIPLAGEQGLASAWLKKEGIAAFLQQLGNPLLGKIAQALAFFAIITSFLGVSISLTHFLRDGLRLQKNSRGRTIAIFLTFFPPLLFVLFYPQGFIVALNYGAVFVAILLGILPALMAWTLPNFRSFFKRALLLTVIFASLFVIVIDILEESGDLSLLIEKYIN